MKAKIGFIGTGNMGSAMVKGLINSGTIRPENICLFDLDRAKAEALRQETGARALSGCEDLVRESDVVVLAVKPNAVKGVLEECKGVFDGKKILVSIAVGIPIKFYESILGSDRKIVRTMPNTPLLVGEGMTLICGNSCVGSDELEELKKLFTCAGKAEIIDENLMSEVTALTSSSPAYVFMFIEAMADAAVLSGIPRDLAYRLAAQAVLGSAKMVLDTGKHPGELKDMVCSPGGTTIRAVAALEKNGFKYAVMDAMEECTRRAREIGKTLMEGVSNC